MFDRSQNHAWGAPIKEAATAWVVGKVELPKSPEAYLSKLVTKDVTVTPGVDVAAVRETIGKLKHLAAVIEADIAYFNLQKGQGMAMNRFSFLKRDVLDNVARLEKACPSH